MSCGSVQKRHRCESCYWSVLWERCLARGIGCLQSGAHMPSPTVVLDTNVFVAARFNPHSASAQIVDAVKQGQLRMAWNDATRREIERITQQIPPLRTTSTAKFFRPADRFTDTTHPEQFLDIPDPADRTFAALAHAAGAVLISNDGHLLQHRDHVEVSVLTPSEFWQRQQHPKTAHRRTSRPT